MRRMAGGSNVFPGRIARVLLPVWAVHVSHVRIAALSWYERLTAVVIQAAMRHHEAVYGETAAVPLVAASRSLAAWLNSSLIRARALLNPAHSTNSSRATGHAAT